MRRDNRRHYAVLVAAVLAFSKEPSNRFRATRRINTFVLAMHFYAIGLNQIGETEYAAAIKEEIRMFRKPQRTEMFRESGVSRTTSENGQT
jgi:hypothetical protein